MKKERGAGTSCYAREGMVSAGSRRLSYLEGTERRGHEKRMGREMREEDMGREGDFVGAIWGWGRRKEEWMG